MNPSSSISTTRRQTTLWLLGLASAFATPAWAARRKPRKVDAAGPLYRDHPEAMALADELANTHGIDRRWARQTLGQARRHSTVIQLMSPAPTGFQKNWQVYRSRFIEPRRIQAGVQFWDRHDGTLRAAEQRFGVPASVIVGILGVETIYGRDTGQFRVLDALSTLAFDFPASHPRASERQSYFRSELGQFLLLARSAKRDPSSFKGSYAGAMGWPQFMPSSIARFAVDMDDDGRVDLNDSVADIVGSVGHYLQQHGWISGQPGIYQATFASDFKADELPRLLAPDILPSFNPGQLAQAGMVLDAETLAHPGRLALVELRNGSEAPQYVLGTENFYVITRYNWSAYYAMAVLELGQAVAQARSVQMPGLAPASVPAMPAGSGPAKNASNVQ